MKKLLLPVTGACLCILTSSLTLAQTSPPPLPAVLVINREEIKPGKMDAHAEEAMANVRVMAKTNTMISDKDARTYRIAMIPIAGNQNEVTYVFAHASFANMEGKQKEIDRLSAGAMKADYAALVDREYHASQGNLIAGARPDLSYGLGNVDMAQARYVTMTTLRIKPGHEDEYWEATKRINYAARDRTPLKTGASYAVFAVRGGAPGTTYLIFRPLKSLADLDGPSPATIRAGMSREEKEEIDKVVDRSVLLTVTNMYAIDPRLSLVSAEFAARDPASPAFWITNPAPPPPAVTTAAAPARVGARAPRRPQ